MTSNTTPPPPFSDPRSLSQELPRHSHFHQECSRQSCRARLILHEEYWQVTAGWQGTAGYLNTTQACGHATNNLVRVLELTVVSQVCAHDDSDHAQGVGETQRHPMQGEPAAPLVLATASDHNASR